MLLLPPPLFDRVHHMECFDLLRLIPAGTIDAIITDLPYQVTACSWDQIIPFAPMWAEVKRVLKPRGVFVTTASQPFTSALVMSNPSWFRYSWVWDKVNRYMGHLDANRRPLSRHDDIIVFSEESPVYYPQMVAGEPYVTHRTGAAKMYNDYIIVSTINTGTRYPHSIINIEADVKTEIGYHPTQKPVALYEYLIRTYTQPGELVLDFCAGSGTTALAARNTNRRFIVGDQSAEYCAIARDRLRMPFEPRQHVKEAPPLSDLPLFAATGD